MDRTSPSTSPELSYTGELKRKALHVLALAVPLVMLWLGKETALLIAVPISLLALSLDYLRVRSRTVAGAIDTLFGSFMRAEERPAFGGPVVINGATWVMVSATVLLAIFPLAVMVPAFISFMLGDAAAAIVGRKFGRIHWPGSKKTLEGSLAYFVVGIAVMAFFPAFPLWMTTTAVFIGTLVELLPGPLNDNMQVPFATALVLYAVVYYFSTPTLQAFT